MSDPRVPAQPERPSAGPSPARLGEEATGASALDRVLKETDYRGRLGREATDLLRLELRLRGGVEGDLSRRFCLRVAEEAERLEYGLLDVGARGNKAHAYFVELVTAVRWCAKALHALLHLRGRIRRYLGDRSDLDDFRRQLDACIAWLASRVEALLRAVRIEAEGPLGLPVPAQPYEASSLRGEDVRWRLPQDLDAPASVDERERLADVATAFLALADEFARLGVPADEPPTLDAYVRERFGVANAQEARVRMHAVQSTYDTAVAGSALEAQDPHLKTLRGYVSILLHLLEAIAYLLQVHARLALDVRSVAVRSRVEAHVTAAGALRWALRFGVVSASACFREARATAVAVLERYTRVREVVLDLPPGRKLHLRPAGLIVRVVQHHGLPVEMGMGDQTVDARQLMEVILLAASHPTSTQVRFRGDERPLEDLQTLFQHRLGEEGFEAWPNSLAYLRESPRSA